MSRSLFILALSLSVSLSSCLVVENPYQAIAPGLWRGVLQLSPRLVEAPEEGEEEVQLGFEEVAQGELPFEFEVIYSDDSTFSIYFINGSERIRIEDVTFGRDRTIARDTLRIEFPIYNSYIRAEVEGPFMEGVWVDRNRTDYRIPFKAQFGKGYRFSRLRKAPAIDLTGRWAATFAPETDAPWPAIAEFSQNGNNLTGTFLTETGDYRFLEGTIQADKLYLSAFDGTHAYLFEGKVLPDSSITGSFRSGSHYRTTWEARPAGSAEGHTLRHPDSLTALTPGSRTIDFSLPDPDGQLISPTDSVHEGTVRIIQILGTWCPNCRDETRFLADLAASYQSSPLTIIGLAFEKLPQDRAESAIRTYRNKLGAQYPILYAGPADKQHVTTVLPALDTVIAFPTLILLDKKGAVRRIHTGFSGPATSEYEAFTTTFTTLIDQLLAEES
jgi:thiol-disulfide isomerase/thioredoxin